MSEILNFRNKIKEDLKEYDPDNVFNCDETGLFWRMEPNKTLAAKNKVLGIKKAKDRITIMLATNSTGTIKLPPVFIHKYQTPRCLKNIDKTTLPVWYYWNSSSWMQTSIFSRWIYHINNIMISKNKKIILLLDNATSHNLENNNFSNIKLYYLPPNTTAYLQPCDQGIIRSFKVSYFIYFFINLFI
jgi:DDE superfamily endonuclease